MISIFRKGMHSITTVVDIVTDTAEELLSQTPILHMPKHIVEYAPSIGDDCNLPLLVRELGGRKKNKLSKRREVILKELDGIDKELLQLDVLLDAANSI